MYIYIYMLSEDFLLFIILPIHWNFYLSKTDFTSPKDRWTDF